MSTMAYINVTHTDGELIDRIEIDLESYEFEVQRDTPTKAVPAEQIADALAFAWARLASRKAWAKS